MTEREAPPTPPTGSPARTSAAAGTATICYESRIVGVGDMVPGFVTDYGILVFFGERAPEELHEISAQHRPSIELAGPAPGDVVEIGDRRIPVLAVGPVVERNLLDLGHINFKANGQVVAEVPGDVCVPVRSLPLPEIGGLFRITRTSGATVAALPPVSGVVRPS